MKLKLDENLGERGRALLAAAGHDVSSVSLQPMESAREARALFDRLPAGEVGCLYLGAHGRPVTPDPAAPEFPALQRYFGSVRGAWPVIKNSP